ncbi:MAG: carboxypeptidase regulatory-like domain-containing protein, partial [Smithella sp.]
MVFKRLFLCGIVACLMFLPCIASAAGDKGSVKGTVHKNSASREALSGVKVKCGGESDKTDDNGKFKIKGVKQGNQTIKFSKDGYESYETTVKIIAGQTANVGNRWLMQKTTADKTKPVINRLELSKSSIKEGEKVEIHYTVSDSGGSGLKQVELWKGKDKGNLGHYKTDKVSGNGPVSGQFKDTPSPAGTFFYGIHVLDNNDNLAYDNGALPVVVEASKSVGSVSGKLHKNSASGAVLSGVSVSCGGKSVTTGNDGKFKLEKIAVGNQTILFSKSEYESYQTNVTIAAGQKANMGDRWLTETKKIISNKYIPNLDNPAYAMSNPLYKYRGHCTWFAWGRAMELTGYKKLPTSNACEWWAQVSQKGQSPRKNSIAVWWSNTKCDPN